MNINGSPSCEPFFLFILIGGKKLEPDKILIDIRTCELTLSQFVAEAYRYIELMPDHEIFMDGDAYALVARKRH